MTDRTPFNSSPVVRPGCQHQLGCRCEPPYWLLDNADPKLARAQAEHRRRLGWPGEPPHCPSCSCGMASEQLESRST